MTKLQDSIAALPEWGHPYACLDRLALARELAEVSDIRLVRHAPNCNFTNMMAGLKCDCGRDALLKALEGPCS